MDAGLASTASLRTSMQKSKAHLVPMIVILESAMTMMSGVMTVVDTGIIDTKYVFMDVMMECVFRRLRILPKDVGQFVALTNVATTPDATVENVPWGEVVPLKAFVSMIVRTNVVAAIVAVSITLQFGHARPSMGVTSR